MIDKLKLLEVIENQLKESSIFLVDLKISTDNKINIYIDGDQGVTIDDCISLSRSIESSLNRDEEDFELNVLSYGVGYPLKLKRQYIKNIGRFIHILKHDLSETEGKLLSADEDKIEIQPEIKKKKPIEENKGLMVLIKYTEIKEAKILIKF